MCLSICVYVYVCTAILLRTHTKIRLDICINVDKSQVLYKVKEVNLKSKLPYDSLHMT